MSIVAIDIGGTFTDLAALDPATGALRFSKSLTTPPEFEQGALDCLKLAGIAASQIDILRHGTTVVINALLERKGARTALVTTEGFRDILEIGRGNRPEGFNLFYERLPPVVPRELRFDLPERMDARGNPLTPVDRDALARVAARIRESGVDAVAVCFLHAWRNPQHEIEVGEYLRAHTGCFVSCSHEISREFREYERTTTVALNAYVGPAVDSYLARFGGTLRKAGFTGRMYLMGSNGGVLTEADTHHRPLLLVESGPVGGVAGAAEIGAAAGLANLVAFDMGGTTAKAVLIENGEAAVSPLYWVGGYERGYPVQAAVLDIIEVGAGGGSIASISDLGALQVGPRSAGALPGPACYARGGTEPTVTDANLLLGRLDSERFLGGTMPLDRDRAAAAIAGLAANLDQPMLALAAGILRIATLNMATAVRKVTIERGYDPRDFAMVAFGGAGPLHAVDVAREIGMTRVIIPPQPGHFSAYGMLFADFRFDLTDTVAAQLQTLDLDDMDRRFVRMESEGRQQIERLGLSVKTIRFFRYAEMRYRRQEYTIKVRLPEGEAIGDRAELRRLFEDSYRKRYGHSSREMEIEVVTLRMVVDGQTVRPSLAATAGRFSQAAAPERREIWFDATGPTACNVWQRRSLPVGSRVEGPGVVEEEASTTVLTAGDTAEIDASGNIVITLGRRP
jgi:N-methylhydantoinase A